MNRRYWFLVALFILSVISGFLMSKATLVSRVGISLFYREYNFLKSWWKGGLAVFSVLMILFISQGLLQSKLQKSTSLKVHFFACILALTGLYFTYVDFRNTLSHQLLGERFHLGAYLFWIGWIGISLFYIVEKEIVDRWQC